MKHVFVYNDQTHDIDLVSVAGGYRITCDGRVCEIRVLESGSNRLVLEMDGEVINFRVGVDRTLHWIGYKGETYALRRVSRSRRPKGGEDNPEGVLRAPMPGQISALTQQVGDRVKTGDTLMILEAMKMEIRIQAPCDGVITSIEVAGGERVEKDQRLAEIQ